jgi:DNA polymerase-3 subunit epsilon/oligoribonuclease
MIGIFLDTETNGLNPQKHRVVEIALIFLNLETGDKLASYETLVSISSQEWKRSDSSSLGVNGFTWDEVQKGKNIAIVSQEIISLFSKHQIQRKQAVFICQNPSFDRAFFGQIVDPDTQEKLLWPYHWLDLASMYWTDCMRKGKTNPKDYPWGKSVSKDAIARALHLPPEEKPHRAMNGTRHLIACYEALIGFPEKQSL